MSTRSDKNTSRRNDQPAADARRHRRLTIEPLAARLVLSATSQLDLPVEVGQPVQSWIADQRAGEQRGSGESIDTLGRFGRREHDRGGDSGVITGYGGSDRRIGRHDGKSQPLETPSFSGLTPPSHQVFDGGGLFLQSTPTIGWLVIIVRGAAAPPNAVVATALESMPGYSAQSFGPGQFDGLAAASFASFAAPRAAALTNTAPSEAGDTSDEATGAADAMPAAITMPQLTAPAGRTTASEGGMIELESPRTHRGGTLLDNVFDDGWHATSPFDLEDELDEIDLDWLWPESYDDKAPADEEADLDDSEADEPAGEAELAIAHDQTSAPDGEGGMIELMAGEPISEIPRATLDEVESIADSNVRMEADVALVRVFDLAPAPGETAASESLPAEPDKLPPSDETTAGQPSTTPLASAAIGAAALAAMPLAKRRWKRDDEPQEAPRR